MGIFNFAIDSELLACDLVTLRVSRISTSTLKVKARNFRGNYPRTPRTQCLREEIEPDSQNHPEPTIGSTGSIIHMA